MIVRTVVISLINLVILSLNLFIERIYDYFVKPTKKNYELLKIITSICCPIATYVVTIHFTTIPTLLKATDSTSLTICYINMVAAFVTLCMKFCQAISKYIKREKEKETYKSFNGVFAVSAIIVTKTNKFILVKRKNSENNPYMWVQPGVYYRTNTLHKDPPELLSYYKQLIGSLKLECGLTENMYVPIQLNSIVKAESATFNGANFTAWSAKYKDNQLSQTPFLIQDEKSEPENRSGTSTHIDSFFAFQLVIDDDELSKILQHIIPEDAKYEMVEAFSLDEIKQMSKEGGMIKDGHTNVCYPDLYVIIDKFIKEWRKEIFVNKFKKNIRYCTFNPYKHTIWLRINDNCNLNCQFCLMQEKWQNSETKLIDFNAFTQFWENKMQFDRMMDYHLIVTGGEPLLVDKLYEIIDYINNHSNGAINSITICTNGTLGTSNSIAIENMEKLLNEECSFKNKLKFVINLSSHSNTSFATITKANGSLFFNQCKFIKTLQESGIKNITANVVMTNVLKNDLNQYFSFWRSINIKNISFSYAIQLGIQYRNITNSIKTLSKSECTKLYNSLEDGKYPIEYFDNIELMIPSCDEKSSCKENNHIRSCIEQAGNWNVISGCLDI